MSVDLHTRLALEVTVDLSELTADISQVTTHEIYILEGKKKQRISHSINRREHNYEPSGTLVLVWSNHLPRE